MTTQAEGYRIARLVAGDGPVAKRLFWTMAQVFEEAHEALSDAYNDYYGAVAEYNRAQFRLYWAIGQPAQELGEGGPLLPPYCPPGTGEMPKGNPGR